MKLTKIVVALLLFTCFFFSVTRAYGAQATTATRLSFDQIKLAAEKGDPDAEYALGYMYYYGKSGAIKDSLEAKKWIEKAAAQNQTQAVKALALINRQSIKKTDQTEKTTPSNKQTVNTDEPVVEQSTEAAESTGKSENHQMAFVDRYHENTRQHLTNSKTVAGIEPTENRQGSFGEYTLQLLGAHQKEPILKMIEKHHLDSAAVYQTSLKNQNWYVLLYGRYKTKEEATRMALKLGHELEVKPWIKPYSSIKGYKKLL